MAEKGAGNTRAPKIPDHPKPPLSLVNTKLNKASQTLWTEEWQQDMTTPQQARELLDIDRITWSRKVSAITGHGPFNYHDHIVDPINGPAVTDVILEQDRIDGTFLLSVQPLQSSGEKSLRTMNKRILYRSQITS